MPEFFPADVSLRVEGDLTDAQALFPAARNLLFRALRRKELGGQDLVKMFMTGTDGSLVSVVLARGLKLVYVQPGPSKVGKVAPEEMEAEQEEVLFFIYTMYSGVVGNPPSIFASPEPEPHLVSDTVLHSFHPDNVCAAAYQLLPEWQNVEKLAVGKDGTNDAGAFATSRYPKPAMFSGSMKRMVQALYGIGRNETDTPSYLTDVVPEVDEFGVVNVNHNYDWHWDKTHGITKVDNGCWLVEISRENGVVAMPLPVFSGTDSANYVKWLASFGDTDTVAVATEFGGLPTGEHFPNGTDLTDALANGKVIQLMPPEDIEPFYHDPTNDVEKFPLFQACGWAFSESGVAAINTVFWYKSIHDAHPQVSWPEWLGYDPDYPGPGLPPTIPYPYTSIDPDDLFARADYYRIDLTLSNINTGLIDATHPAGAGSAVMSLVESRLTGPSFHDFRYFEYSWPTEHQTPGLRLYEGGNFIYVPRDDLDAELDIFFLYGSYTTILRSGLLPSDWVPFFLPIWHSDAVYYAFFVDEAPELLRQNQPARDYLRAKHQIQWSSMLWGTSVDLTTTLYNHGAVLPPAIEASTFIPWGVREGYTFGWAEYWAAFDVPDTPGFWKGFFDDFGVIEFTPSPSLCAANSLSIPTFPNATVRSYFFSPGFPVYFGLTINCGQRLAMIGDDGPNVTDVDPLYRQCVDTSVTVPELEITVDAQAIAHTFVGSP